MRLTILLASVALATPALASGPGHPNPRNPNIQYGGNGNHNNGCGNGNSGNVGKHCGKPQGIPVTKLPHINYGHKQPHPGKPPKLGYEPVPPAWGGPPHATPPGHGHNVNRGKNSNKNSNRNNTHADAAADAAAKAGARAGASATGGSARIGDISTGPSTATASNSNTNNADNSSNLTSSVSVEGDTYINREARNRRIPVGTAYAAPLTSGIDTCLGSASAGVQTGILGVSLGGTKRDRICETIKLSRELHHMGMREGAVQLLCNDPRVRIAMHNAGTPCENVTYVPEPMVYDEPPPPVEYAPPRRKPRRGERG